MSLRRLLLVLAAVVSCLAAPHSGARAETAGYREAEAQFRQLTPDQRHELQMLMAAAGYWDSLSTDRYGRKLFDAVRRVQGLFGWPETGFLTREFIGRLHDEADPVLAAWDLKEVRHPATGTPLWVPAGLGLDTEKTKDGLNFRDRDKTITVSFDFFRNVSVKQAYEVVLRVNREERTDVLYKAVDGNSFAVVARKENVRYHVRHQKVRGGVVGFTLIAREDAAFHPERLAVLMADLFRAHFAESGHRTPPVPIRRDPPQDESPPVANRGPSEPRRTAKAEPGEIPPATLRRDSPQGESPPVANRGPSEPRRTAKAEREPESGDTTGTGFFVSKQGHVLTNAHVVRGCTSLSVSQGGYKAASVRVVATDEQSDLALVKTDMKPDKVASLRVGIRLGESVAAFGFPLTGLLSSDGNFTLGNITALTGLRDNKRQLQISAPVQPGNSGGPLLDMNGNVVGVVVGKLNALKLAGLTDDLAQNVNFAVKASVATTFLEAQDIPFPTGATAPATKYDTADVAELAKSMSVYIECHK